ncbi:MAG: lysozyme [Bacteroidetes bacterium]|nr:lysozyme [Bacteroidota bacterium]
MKIDAAGIKLITDLESLRLKAYQDPGGVWTIGYGHTRTARAGMTITKEKAIRLFQEDVRDFEECVSRAVMLPSLTQAQFNALVSFAYNRGCNGFKRSDLLTAINQGKFLEAARLWPQTAITINGKKAGGLVKRRKRELAMFNGNAQDPVSLKNWAFFGSLKAIIGRA